MDADDAAEHDRCLVRLAAFLDRHLDRLPVLALERNRRFGDARRLDVARRRRRQAGELHLVDAIVDHRRRDVHLLGQNGAHHVDHELAGFLGIAPAVLGRVVAVGAGGREVDHRRRGADGVVEAVGREVHAALAVEGRDPADRPRHDQRRQRVLRHAVVAPCGIVEHPCLLPIDTSGRRAAACARHCRSWCIRCSPGARPA